MKKILVVNVNWLGDVIFSTPVFKALKHLYPSAKISCLAVPRVKEVLEHCPFVDEVIVYDDRKNLGSLLGKFALIFKLRCHSFDSVFLLHRSMTRALLMFLAGIPVRVGFRSAKQSCFLTHAVIPSPIALHRSDEYLQVVEGFGVPVTDRRCELAVSPEDSFIVGEKLITSGIGNNEQFLIINPGGNWDKKRWPPALFSELARRLIKEFGWKVIISGGPGDIALAHQIADASHADPIVWAGQTSLGGLAALYEKAQFVISNDSGPSHVASSVGTDVIVLFGPTRPEITSPRGTGKVSIIFKDVGCNKAPCYHLTCLSNVCMQEITVQDVLQVINQESR